MKLLRKLDRLAAALAVLSLPGTWGIPAVAFAEGDAGNGANLFPDGTNGAAIPGDSGAVFATMVKVVFFLILIIGIFLLIIKFLSKKKWQWSQGRAVKTLGGLPLGPNKSVQIVEIGRSIYVIGVGEDVRLIQKIDDPEEVAYIAATFGLDGSAAGRTFPKVGEWLGGFLKREKQTPDEDDQVAASFQEVFQTKMKHMAGRKQLMEQMLRTGDDADKKVEP